MEHTIAFDTYAYVKKLKAVGVSEEQAEVQAQAIAELVDERLVTRGYLDVRLKELETSLKHDIKEMELRMTIKLGAIMTTGVAIVAVLVKLR
ncbi:MAG: DUF1640 domain-containing protein [Nitrospirae bacterium]|nr:DUF1640 domain-containing protein [Nitrospirota bacterium]MBF0542490.1 DUF1640 domain-containing protein [Nitrospirota bacterium]